MRQSNAEPLTLSSWQYQLLMQWVAGANAAPLDAVSFDRPAAAPSDVAAAAAERRAIVLARLADGSALG
jgi:hypothetical protein